MRGGFDFLVVKRPRQGSQGRHGDKLEKSNDAI